MVVKKNNVTWNSNFSAAELHLSKETTIKNSNITEETNYSWFERQCPILTNSLPQNQVKWKNTFHMRQMTLSNISSTSGQLRQTLSAQAAGTKLRGKYMTSASKSLELLRLNIQTLINKELDAVLKKYLDKFFKPAIENIRNNLGENSVTDDSIRLVCRQILEDAKIQYYNRSQSRGSSPFSDSETGSVGDSRLGQTPSRSPLSFLRNKRKESDTDSEASQSVLKPKKKALRAVTNTTPSVPAALKVMKLESMKREGPKWDPNRIVKSTLFIMGARANKVLGFGQTRGRLYTKHPELLKYSGDTEDKEWLSRHNLMPPTGGIAYLLLLEDVKELAESDEYRHNPNVLLHDLKGFEAPDFMLKKIRAFVAQCRAENKEQNVFGAVKDYNNVYARCNINSDSTSLNVTSPATIFSKTPDTLCESSNLTDSSTNLLTSTHDFLTPGANNGIYDNIIYYEDNKINHSLFYSSGSSLNGNFSNQSALTSLLVSPLENDI